MMDTSISAPIPNKPKDDTQDKSIENQNKKEVSDNSCNTPVSDIEAPLSPVLTNSKKSLRHIARRKSRIKLLNKFSQNSLVSQETCTPLEQSQVDENELSIEIFVENSAVTADSLEKEHYEDNELKQRMKRCLELQRNKKFCYKIAVNSSKILENSKSNDSNFKIFESSENISKIDNLKSIEPFVSNVNITDCKTESDFNFKIPESPVSLSKSKKNNNIKVRTDNATNSERNINLNIGFETGSGKKINLSEKAIKRAAKLFDDIIDTPEQSEVLSNYEKLEDIKTETSFNKNKNRDNQGFKISGGNFSESSKYSAKKDESLFDEIFDLSNESQNEPKSANFELKPNSNQKLQNVVDENNSATNTKIKHPTQFKIPPQQIENKLIYKSNQGLSPEDKTFSFTQITDTQMCSAAENAECLSDFILNTQWTPSPKDKSHDPKIQLSNEKKISKSQDDEFVSPESDQFFGNLTVCEDGTVATRNNESNSVITENIEKSLIRIETGSGEKLTITEESINKAENISVDCYVDKNSETRFFTASGKNVTISEESLRKTKNMFDDCNFIEENIDKNIFSDKTAIGFSTASGKKVSISKESLKKVENIFQGCDITSDITEKNVQIAEFSTASGKKVAISEESLNKAKNIFQDCVENTVEENTEKNIVSELMTAGFSTASGKKVSVSQESLKKAENIFQDCDIVEENIEKNIVSELMTSGFSTASGKKVFISEEFLKKAKNIIEDFDIVEENTEKNIVSELMTSKFSTDFGKKVLISEESLNKAENSFENCDLLEENTEKKCAPENIKAEFSRASDKNLLLSKESLKKVENTFEDCIIEESSQNNLTTQVKPIISEDTIELNKEISADLSTVKEEHVAETSMPSGFLTASGKKIVISEEVLNKVRNIFEDPSDLNKEILEEEMLDFATPFASITILEESIKKSNNLEVSESNEHSQQSFTSTPDKDTNCNFCGFTWDESLISYKIYERYKRSFNCIEKYIKKNVLHPFIFTFDTVQSSKQYKNKNYKYALRFRKKSSVIYGDTKSKSSRSQRKSIKNSPKTPELLNTSNIVTRSRSNLTIEDTSPSLLENSLPKTKSRKRKSEDNFNIDNNNQNNSSESNTSNSENKSSVINYDKNIDTNKTIEDLEEAFLSYIENTLKETSVNSQETNTTDSFLSTEEINSLKENFSAEPSFNTPPNINSINSEAEKSVKVVQKNKIDVNNLENVIKVKEEIVENTKQVFNKTNEDLKNNITQNVSPQNINKPLFISQSNKDNILETSSENKNIVDDINNLNLTSISDLKFGFSTASAKKITVTEENLKKSINFFQDYDVAQNVSNNLSTPSIENKLAVLNSVIKENIETPRHESSLGFATASDQKFAIPADALKKEKCIFQDCDVTEEIPNNTIDTPKNTTTFGFATASGKKVTISEDALKKARNIFQDCDITEENVDKNIGTPKNALALGFSTASGKKVSISEDALQKAKTIFQDCDITEENVDKNISTPKNVSSFGFATATGKKVSISEDALKKAKNIFQDCEITEENVDKNIGTPKNTLSLGFTTATGKKVSISEDALKKAKNIFQDCDNTEENVDKNIGTPKNALSLGFATASGKKVPISEHALKKAKNIFQDCDITEENVDKNISTPKNVSSFGFATASGKKVSISEDSLKKAKYIFQDCDIGEETTDNNLDTPKNVSSFGFATASGKKVTISEDALEKTKNIFQDCDIDNENIDKNLDTPKHVSSFGFATASGRKVAVSEDALKKTKNLFQDCDITEENIDKNLDYPKHMSSLGFATACGRKVAVSEDALKKAKNLFQDCDITEENKDTPKTKLSFGFDTASGKKVVVSEEALAKAKTMFEEIIETNISTPKTSLTDEFSSVSEKKVTVSETGLKRARYIFEDVEDTKENLKDECATTSISEKSFKKMRSISENEENRSTINTPKNINQQSATAANKSYSSPQMSPNDSTPILRKKTLSIRNSKKRSLGVTPCKQIDIPENSLKRAKLVFDDVETPKKKETTINNNNLQSYSPFTNKTNSSVVKTPLNIVSRSTPTISTPNKSLLNSNISMKESNQIISSQNLITPKISPLKRLHIGNGNIDENLRFVFQERTIGDIKKWNTDLQKEIEMLKLKMSVVETRMMMLNEQQEIIETGSSDHRRQRPGSLFTQKLNNNRLTLKEAVNNRRPEKNTHQICLKMGLDPSLLEITSENSSNLHFHVPWWTNDNRTYPAVIRTEDGAVIIPNQQNYVGITELERAFLAMPGVDPSLVPKKWVSNHYRWIVWKLASLERNFPDVFKSCLSVESVLSQLKYRYDREIDRAQRPAIKKIVECDDTAAKRMVLCVATVIKLAENKYELELTDGWYSIKTILDIPLNNLVERNVIKNGMKLITQGAELLNCEGCCPLELPANVRLQIHYNSTRRAAWHAKLGYQPNPGPLRISLRMISGNGGPIGAVSGYVARLYPISFMERCDVAITWRNQRAELRRANQWEASYANMMETIQICVQEELEKEWAEREKKNKNKRIKIKDVNGINCGRTLYQFIEDSNDPDSVKELLTTNQISALQDYQTELNIERQSELTSRLRQKLSNDKIKPRNVSTVLKLLLVDVQSPYHHRMLSVWRPTETHTQLLKEGIVINIYNVTAKNNGTLSSIPRTQFDINSDIDTTKFENTNRFVIPISQISNPSLKPQFGEFDTVGMVVTIDVRPTGQTLWLADETYRFLMVQIREGPETCSLFDGISSGKIVAVTNLIHQKPFKFYGEAIGNHYTVLSSYPQQPYLQDCMQEFIENLSEQTENIDQYLEECKNRIEEISSQNLKRGYVLNPLNPNHLEEETESLTKKLCGVESTQPNKSDSLTLSDEEMALIDTQVM